MAPQPAAAEGFWIFGKKKKQESAASAQEQQIFNSKADEKKPAKKSFMSKILGTDQAKKAPDVKINGVTVKGLRPEMLVSSYIPKSPDEIMLLALAHKSWEGDAMVAKQAQANARIAAAQNKSEDALQKMRAESAKQMMNASTGVATPDGVRPGAKGKGSSGASARAEEKPIFNKPALKAPAKVFTDYR